jgi:hypothetical protein
MKCLDLFTSREIAIGLWLVVVLIFFLAKEKLRNALWKVVVGFFRIKVFGWVLLMTLYCTCVVAVLWLIGLWNIDLLKDSIFWLLFSGITMLFSIATSEDEIKPIRKMLKDNIKIVLIIEFISNTYTFSLLVEIVLLPIIAFIAMLDAVAGSDLKYGTVARITTMLQILIGISVIAVAIIKAIVDYRSLLTLDSLRSLLLPVILSIMLSPYILIVLLIITYEQIFLRLRFGPTKEKALIKYAKARIIRNLGLNISFSRQFLKSKSVNLLQIQTKQDVDMLFS